MKIKGILTRLYSLRDRNGNVYVALRYTDTKTGKTVEATSGGNVEHVPRYLGPRGSILYQEEGMGQRDFFRLTKHWPHAEDSPEAQAAWINAAIRKS